MPEIVHFPNGTASIRPAPGHEPMHSMIGAWAEAQALYIGQSRLAELLAVPGPELVIYDIGLGIAANAVGALEQAQVRGVRRRLRVISFENDLCGLRLALENVDCFRFLREYRELIPRLLAQGEVECELWRWQLVKGDFLELAFGGLPAPGVIFYDFYSPGTCETLWGVRAFSKLRGLCAEHPCLLYTYSSSTAARAAMVLAGFFVGEGVRTQAKLNTTQAATRLEDLGAPLARDWLGRLGRSGKPLPGDWALSGALTAAEALDRVRCAGQFGKI